MVDIQGNRPETDFLKEGLISLGLEADKDNLLFFVKDRDSYVNKPFIWFQLEQAGLYHADAVFFKKSMRENEYIPQIYIYDCTKDKLADAEQLTEIHKRVWTGGEIPLVCVFSKTEIKILDTTKPIEESKDGAYRPAYLIENLKTIIKVHKVFNEDFGQKLKSGAYWDNANVNFDRNSSYSKLTALLRKVIDKFIANSGLEDHKDVVQKLIIQCILVKYLEERRDENNNRVFPSSYFNDYNEASQFSDVLNNGKIFDFFADLNSNHFNGGIFAWDESQKALFEEKQEAFHYLSEVLRGYTEESGQTLIQFEDSFSRLYEFNYIPVELISRLYEEFIIKENKRRVQDSEESENSQKKNDGVAYTPSHLVKLLVNEAMPLSEAPQNVDDFKLLDPACGSAIFLVVAFKRLVQWWRQQNQYKKPTIDDLMKLLNSVYGIDIDSKAVQISIFSLCIALCDELSPKEIWDNLKFANLENKTIFEKDFFEWKEEWLKNKDNHKFDVIIGNPPFKYDDNKRYSWKFKNKTINIPRNQMALRFVSESMGLLKEKGLSCLIVKSSPLLYINSNTAQNYLQALISNFHVNQIFDFTPLARNGVLWDGVDVDSAAVFISNTLPDYNKNILHAIFRRTKANKERIYFEIDKYDLHFILREEAYKNPYIFKINLLGGGRINNLIKRCLNHGTFESYILKRNCWWTEGYIAGNQNESTLTPNFMYGLKVLPTSALGENGIDKSKLEIIPPDIKFRSVPKDEIAFNHPNILIKKNIGNVERIPIFFNKNIDFAFKDKIIGVYSREKDVSVLTDIYNYFVENMNLLRFFSLITSAQALVTKNTVLLKEDIGRLPISDKNIHLNISDINIIKDVLNYTQYFIRRPETAEALAPLKDIKEEISFYGDGFSDAINDLYADDINSFKLISIIRFEKEDLIGALFSYDEISDVEPQELNETQVSGIDGFINFDINESLTATRIIQYYAPNKVLFVKPNQKRYWLASIAYRDADSVFADILNNQ